MSLCTGAAKLTAIAAFSGAALLGSTAVSSASGKLMEMLPQGFSSTNCVEKQASGPAVERVTCDASSDASGPSYALFLLYASSSDLASEFKSGPASGGYKVSSSCPGGKASPGDWSYGNSSQAAGEVECATSSEGYPTIIWSDTSKLRVGVVEGKGKDMDALFKWWSDKS